MHYLKTNVVGDAERLLRAITTTEANYQEAWKKLKDRYDHKRYIVDSLLKKFFGQPKINSENHVEIKSLIDTSSEVIQSLSLQGIPVHKWDAVVVHVIVSKLDTETHKQWELKQTKDEIPTFKQLQEFLESRWQSLEMIHGGRPTGGYNFQPGNRDQDNRKRSEWSNSDVQQSKVESRCFGCSEIGHKLYNCSKYNSFSVTERKNLLKNNKLCFNCLANRHTPADCKSLSRCKSCRGKHHTSIHTESTNISNNTSSDTQVSSEKRVTGMAESRGLKREILLATAIIFVHTIYGEKIAAKALVDQGSQNTLITAALAKKLGLIGRKKCVEIIGIGDIKVPSQDEMVTLKFSSHTDPSFEMNVSTSVINKISGDLPMIPVHRENWPHLANVKFADPHFDHPSSVEVLLGMEVYERIYMKGIKKKVNSSPTAQNSRLGWLLFGVVKSAEQSRKMREVNSTFLVNSADYNLEQTLKSFWELEEIPEARKLTIKEQEAEDKFLESVHRNNEGRYVVALPFDSGKQSMEIGESKKAALNGLLRLEARFKNSEQLRNRYKDYIQALIEANHIELVPRDRINLLESIIYLITP